VVTINPRRIPGNWRQGYVLDYHTLSSEFLGHDEYGHPQFETKRSEVGELLYRLKYKSERQALQPLVETAAQFITSRRLTLDFILPVPPSKSRPFQPVWEIAKGLSKQLNVPYRDDLIVKTKDTAELKNVYDFNERLKLLENAYTIQEPSLLTGKTILLFDDLFRSGATMNAIADALYTQAQVTTLCAFALTKTRSNA
jgi:competence protein ComFC